MVSVLDTKVFNTTNGGLTWTDCLLQVRTKDLKRVSIYRSKRRHDTCGGEIFKVVGGIDYRGLDGFGYPRIETNGTLL